MNHHSTHKKREKKDHLQSGTLPRPRHRVERIRIPYANGLHRYARIEGARLEGDQAGAIRAGALRENDDLRPVGGRLGALDDAPNGVLARVRIVTPHVERLREIDQFFFYFFVTAEWAERERELEN